MLPFSTREDQEAMAMKGLSFYNITQSPNNLNHIRAAAAIH